MELKKRTNQIYGLRLQTRYEIEFLFSACAAAFFNLIYLMSVRNLAPSQQLSSILLMINAD